MQLAQSEQGEGTGEKWYREVVCQQIFLQKNHLGNRNGTDRIGTDIPAFCLQPGGNITSSKHHRFPASFCPLARFLFHQAHPESLHPEGRMAPWHLHAQPHSFTLVSQISYQFIPQPGNTHCRAKKGEKRQERSNKGIQTLLLPLKLCIHRSASCP